MGSSWGAASKSKSKADFSGHPLVEDKEKNFFYYPFWEGDSFKIREFRLKGKDTIYSRTETINFIVGSGQHTNSHIFSENGFLFQAPLTYYTQKGKWDLPPGFDAGNNSRFSRKIGLECMSCHNAIPEFSLGSENHFDRVPGGIDCERCHGPGSIHVLQKQKGILVDTSSFIDYSIVNPGKLSLERQFDVCQRCHLQGNTVLKEGKSFFDFKPGMILSDVMAVFLPVYQDSKNDFIMASHVDRLKQSECFIKSFDPEKSKTDLRPHKNSLTCVTCHDPHVSVKITEANVFNTVCNNCHGGKPGLKLCTESESIRKLNEDNCNGCHMPKSGSIDIPHVSVTDHFIRKPAQKVDIGKVRTFLRLACINEPSPGVETRAKAFLQQFERFEKRGYYLDSAKSLLPVTAANNPEWAIHASIHLLYLKNDFEGIISFANTIGNERLKKSILVQQSLDNRDAWTSYRLGEAFYSKGKFDEAYNYFNISCGLAPLVIDFAIKKGVTLILLKKPAEANSLLKKWLFMDAKNPVFLNNLGYSFLLLDQPAKALENYLLSMALDPDYTAVLENLVGYYRFVGNKKEEDRYKRKLEILRP